MDDVRPGEGDVSDEIVARLRAVCAALPETREEQAWTGTRWVVRTKTFAHVLLIDAGWPPVYAREAGTDGPATVLMFRSSGPDLEALRQAGDPFFSPIWRADEIGLKLGADTDWSEVAELLAQSYQAQAPAKLAALLGDEAVGEGSRVTGPQATQATSSTDARSRAVRSSTP